MAVIVPVHHQQLTPDEEISRRHLARFLGHYDKYLVVPETLRIDMPGFSVQRFNDSFFRNTFTYSKLLLTSEFYRTFADYEFILIYQLDALVFSDQLLKWCAKGWDYIGAPWLKCRDVDFVSEATVGNGGFSLRRIDSFLKVTELPGIDLELRRYDDFFRPHGTTKERVEERRPGLVQRIAWKLGLFQPPAKDILGISAAAMRSYGLNEDFFWSLKASRYYPGFRIAPVAAALSFSFEVAPRLCYEMNGRQLPFGCHAWNRYDRKFWEPFLLK